MGKVTDTDITSLRAGNITRSLTGTPPRHHARPTEQPGLRSGADYQITDYKLRVYIKLELYFGERPRRRVEAMPVQNFHQTLFHAAFACIVMQLYVARTREF